MVLLAASAELLGGLALLAGLATRLVVLPLMVTMLVAAGTAHWDNGWFAIAPGDPHTSTAKVLAMVGVPAAERSLENSVGCGRAPRCGEVAVKASRQLQLAHREGRFGDS